jgi:hypothetical protein
VGRDAQIQALAKNVLPDRVFDAVVRRFFGLTNEPPPAPTPVENRELAADRLTT